MRHHVDRFPKRGGAALEKNIHVLGFATVAQKQTHSSRAGEVL